MMEDKNEVGTDLMASRPTWPSGVYLMKAAAIYLLWSAFAALVMFVGIAVYSFPLNVAVFIAGIAVAVVSGRLWKAGVGNFVLRRVGLSSAAITGH